LIEKNIDTSFASLRFDILVNESISCLVKTHETLYIYKLCERFDLISSYFLRNLRQIGRILHSRMRRASTKGKRLIAFNISARWAEPMIIP